MPGEDEVRHSRKVIKKSIHRRKTKHRGKKGKEKKHRKKYHDIVLKQEFFAEPRGVEIEIEINGENQTKENESLQEGAFEDSIKSWAAKGMVSSKHGHFCYGDVPELIFFERAETLATNEKQNYFLVTWRPRKDGRIPRETLFSSSELAKECPQTLIRFYESRLFIKTQNHIFRKRTHVNKKIFPEIDEMNICDPQPEENLQVEPINQHEAQ